MTIFDTALEFVLRSEGGYVDNPADSGGATNYGITQNVYNTYRKSHSKPIEDVKNITYIEVSDIYYNEYWIASGCSKLTNKLAVVVFDTAVNMGVSRAQNFLKLSISNVDKYLALREGKYIEFAQDVPSQKIFLNGWLNRIKNLKLFISKIS